LIYICADDYGLCPISSQRIHNCLNGGCLNKVSIFPNFDNWCMEDFSDAPQVKLSVHINLVEGKCLSNPLDIPLISEKDGTFKHTFTGLLKLSLTRKKAFEAQVYKEIVCQIKKHKSLVGEDADIFVDTHQHTHMIPSVFKMLLKAIEDEKVKVKYIRIPAEPLMPFIKTPSLYFTYSPVNLVKQWLLKFLWQINKKEYKKQPLPTAYFFGILFSGRMDEKRVNKVLPHYIRLAEKKGIDIEVLFHPGYLEKGELTPKLAFESFYFSTGRKEEYNAVMNLDI